jgi:hypothetical protein
MLADLDRPLGVGVLLLSIEVYKPSIRSLPLIARERGIAAPPNFISLVCEGTHMATKECFGCRSRKCLIFVDAHIVGACPSFREPDSMLREAA